MAEKPARPPTGQTDQPDSVVFQKFSGMKNVVTSERLGPDELETAINIDIDDAGQIHRRRGRMLVATGDWSSLHTGLSGRVYAVKDGNLGVIEPNYNFSILKGGFPS